MQSKTWPGWWDWDLELTPHVQKRMLDRQFDEVDLRRMLEEAVGYQQDFVEDRFIIETAHQGRLWRVVVEPDEELQLLVVVTAYRMEEG